MDDFAQPYIGKDERSCPYCNLILSRCELKTQQCHHCHNDLPQDFK